MSCCVVGPGFLKSSPTSVGMTQTIVDFPTLCDYKKSIGWNHALLNKQLTNLTTFCFVFNVVLMSCFNLTTVSTRHGFKKQSFEEHGSRSRFSERT